jgi:hypothetical protein
MPLRFWFHLAEIAFISFLGCALFISWREGRIDHDQLTAALAAAKQTLSAADARQHDRDTQLNQTLAGIGALRSQFQTPAQLTKDLTTQIPLPLPLEYQTLPTATKNGASLSSKGPGSSPTPVSGRNPKNLPDAPKPSADQTVIPSQDLKPLYDFALDCKSCQAKLAAAQGDLADERAKTAALGKERDAALKAAKGGGLWRRMTRAAKWFAIGAAAGALAAKSAH